MKKILNVVNKISSTSIPVEVANKIDDSDFESILLSLYDSQEEVNEKTKANDIFCKSFGINLKNKLNFKKLYNLYKLLNKIKPDIIHIHHSYSGIIVGIMSLFLKDCSLAATVHNDLRYFNSYQKYMRYISYLLCDIIICNSLNTRNNLFPMIKNKKDVRVVYNGIDLKKIFKNNHDEDIKINKNEKFIISNVAMLVPQKDQLTLLKGFKSFLNKSKIDDAQLIIVGEGVLKGELQKFIISNKLDKKVILTGLVARDEVYQIINHSNVFVISSEYEGFCNAMVEAMVAKNAVIASDIEPLPEVLGGNNGLFFEQGNADDLAEKINYLYQNKKIRIKLAEKARNYAVSNYSLEKSVEEYKKIYNEILT